MPSFGRKYVKLRAANPGVGAVILELEPPTLELEP